MSRIGELRGNGDLGRLLEASLGKRRRALLDEDFVDRRGGEIGVIAGSLRGAVTASGVRPLPLPLHRGPSKAPLEALRYQMPRACGPQRADLEHRLDAEHRPTTDPRRSVESERENHDQAQPPRSHRRPRPRLGRGAVFLRVRAVRPTRADGGKGASPRRRGRSRCASGGSKRHAPHGELSAERGHAVIVYFYPKDGTPGCTTEACTFRDSWDKFKQAGVQIFGVSAQDQASHDKFAKEEKLEFQLLADPDLVWAKAFGVGAFIESHQARELPPRQGRQGRQGLSRRRAGAACGRGARRRGRPEIARDGVARRLRVRARGGPAAVRSSLSRRERSAERAHRARAPRDHRRIPWGHLGSRLRRR